MLGPRQEAQAALFYEFRWKIMFPKIIYCLAASFSTTNLGFL